MLVPAISAFTIDLFKDENLPLALKKWPHTDNDTLEGSKDRASKREHCELDEARHAFII